MYHCKHTTIIALFLSFQLLTMMAFFSHLVNGMPTKGPTFTGTCSRPDEGYMYILRHPTSNYKLLHPHMGAAQGDERLQSSGSYLAEPVCQACTLGTSKAPSNCAG